MANILLLDDEQAITQEFASYITQMGHNPFTCQTIDEVLALKDKFEDKNEQIDLFILDHDLGAGDTSLALIRLFDHEEYFGYQNHFIVATGHADDNITYDYTKYGSMGHLIKPIHQAQFTQTVNHVLKKIEYNETQEENWQAAYELLENMGLIDSIDKIQKNNEDINSQYLALKEIYERLVEDLKDKKGEDVAKAYESASNAVNRIQAGFDIIYEHKGYMIFTKEFLEDAESFYKKDKLIFFRLLSYMDRINNAPQNYRVKKLHGGGDNYYEYRIGKDYRLYYSKVDSNIHLERFGHKNIQDKIIDSHN